jgi:riboflavin kinase / FMN adenylyltransferase
MRIWHHVLEAAPPEGPSVVTLGNFDGVHAGHQRVLELAATRARALGVMAAAVTFEPHPSVIVAPERRPLLLMTLKQKLGAFQDCGLDLAWVLPFSRAFSELSPDTFLRGLGAALRPVELHVGRGFRFGRDRAGSLESLETWGLGAGCQVVGHAFQAPDGGPLSSSRIREALARGDVDGAARMLGRPYCLTGIVVEGARRGRHLGFPTANLAWEQEALPAKGVYVTAVRSPRWEGPRPGLTNVGEKPTFGAPALSVETHLPGMDLDIYGAHLDLAFLHRLREEARFLDSDALRVRIALDVEEGLTWWEART